MWGFPGSGIELVSPALAGGFFTTEPPEKPQFGLILEKSYVILRGQIKKKLIRSLVLKSANKVLQSYHFLLFFLYEKGSQNPGIGKSRTSDVPLCVGRRRKSLKRRGGRGMALRQQNILCKKLEESPQPRRWRQRSPSQWRSLHSSVQGRETSSVSLLSTLLQPFCCSLGVTFGLVQIRVLWGSEGGVPCEGWKSAFPAAAVLQTPLSQVQLGGALRRVRLLGDRDAFPGQLPSGGRPIRSKFLPIWSTSECLCEDTASVPHVYRRCIGRLQKNFWSSRFQSVNNHRCIAVW